MAEDENGILSGIWLASYSPQDFPESEVLGLLTDLDRWRLEKGVKTRRTRVILDRNLKSNNFWLDPRGMVVRMGDFRLDRLEKILPVKNFPPVPPVSPLPLVRVSLLYPAMISDKRWKSIEIPSTWLFLGSSLQNAGFEVKASILPLPSEYPGYQQNPPDLLALTLYEENRSDIDSFLASIPQKSSMMIAAGGPLVTQNPLQSAFHLPDINLLVRGEADFLLTDLLKAIQSGNPEKMLLHGGFLFRRDGFMIIADFDQINRPTDFSSFRFNLNFLRQRQLAKGLEINTSRGCSRNCRFCSHLQGKVHRKLPLPVLNQLLEHFTEKLRSADLETPRSRTVNINDDDLLQDPDHARDVLDLIRHHRYLIWGVQTSINSFFPTLNTLNIELLDTLSEPSRYVNRTPLLWIGTDTFLKKRGRRLGKRVPTQAQIEDLIQALEERNIINFHYWISSDAHTEWAEFIEELFYLSYLNERFHSFRILAHAPFLIPYSGTPIFRMLMKDSKLSSQIKYRSILKAGRKSFNLIEVDRVETRFPFLNKLLSNESTAHGSGFFDHLKSSDYFRAINTALGFLRQERLSAPAAENRDYIDSLRKIENKIEFKLGEMMPGGRKKNGQPH